jgi:hypothetical protein
VPAAADRGIAAERGPTQAERPVDATVAPPRARPVPSVPRWLRWLPAAALTVAALIMLIFFLIVSHSVWWGRPSAGAVRDEVLAQAKRCFALVNTYHYQSLGSDEAKGVACATGAYAKNYRNAMDSFIKPTATREHATQIAQINQAGIVSVSNANSWTLLVVGQLNIRQASTPQGRTDPFAAQIEVTKVGGRWRIARVQEVSGPAR